MTESKSEEIAKILLGDSPAIHAVRSRIERVADDASSIIVTGPSGSGKECVARALHYAGERKIGPFVAVNCGAIPRELIESELFGHERGSFTGAHSARAGRFEQAHGGTLFLDEIGDMPVDMQVKLLRVIEERAVERVGGARLIPVDVRIVSATHRDFDDAIVEGTFREDLYYRLAVIPINLPPLSARIQDIPLLLHHFLEGNGRRSGRVVLSDEAITCLEQHNWPGNVRELRNFAERAAILHQGETIGAREVSALLTRAPRTAFGASAPQCLPLAIQPKTCDLTAEMARLEAGYIRRALAESRGIVAVAARNLGLRRTTLVEKMRRYNLPRSDDQTSATGSMTAIAA